MKVSWGIDDVVGEYISIRFPRLTSHALYKPHVAVGFVDNDNVLIGGLGLRRLNLFDGELSIAAEKRNFISSNILRELFTWAFIDQGFTRLTCNIAKPNKRARRFVEKVGFSLEGTKKKGFDGVKDACVYGMLKEDCRWILRGSI